jgi:hypothetical protein
VLHVSAIEGHPQALFLVRIPVHCALTEFLYYDLLCDIFLVCGHPHFAGMSPSCVCVLGAPFVFSVPEDGPLWPKHVACLNILTF